MGMMQRRKRYSLERSSAEKRGKVYADGQKAYSAYVRRVIAAAKYMQAMTGIMHKVQAIRMKAKGIAPDCAKTVTVNLLDHQGFAGLPSDLDAIFTGMTAPRDNRDVIR